MSAALKTPDHDGGLFYVRRSQPPAQLDELTRVEILVDVQTDAGVMMPTGSKGTIVGVWADGKAYEVEFREPMGALATVTAESLRAA